MTDKTVGWVTVSEQVSIPVAVGQVWAAIADPARSPAIDPRFALVSTDGPVCGCAGWSDGGFRGRIG